ncbi:MAG: sigma-E processing peptidase SpoIIGA [Clostridia bacterium]|nr:sigma-E processing peptidase SpoIIGA [Clostridia bacterium]
MPTFLELYLVCNFVLNMLAIFVCKKVFKGKAGLIKICLFCLVQTTIKFLLDYFKTNLVAEMLVVFFSSLSGLIIVFGLNHISKLIKFGAVYFAFLVLVLGGQFVLSVVTHQTAINYISNRYLLLQASLGIVAYSISHLLVDYFSLKRDFLLTRDCTLEIGDSKIAITGFIDTGNKLVDPESNKGVVIVNLSAVKTHLPTNVYADIVLATNSCGKLEKIHKIKYITISGTNFITVFKPSQFLVSGRPIDCFVGICTDSTIKSHDALLNASCF